MLKFWHQNKGLITFLFLMLFFRSAVADWYRVPTGSMQPNILIGDRVWVNKLAYDVKVPLTQINLYRHDDPLSGDIVVFQSEKAGERLIKRVIGTPGDKVAMVNNRLKINGEWVDIINLDPKQTFDPFLNDRDSAFYMDESVTMNSAKSEKIHYPIRLTKNRLNHLSSFNEISVPFDHLLVLGDNRDNSADSRVIGLVPRGELIGKAENVVISFDANNYYLPRNGRYWQKL